MHALGSEQKGGMRDFDAHFSLKTGLSLNCVNIKASGISPEGVQTGPPGDMRQQRRQDAAGS